ncbi:hypothetical protein Ahy_A07g033578 [Arachis hypogaea]|uniref:Aminotransferase-like plant mobile domain-containing protein n=1 Tax=Arachis hypogaea TaxID=3818 RepID=A0A445C9L6_ARAHY|nr:hypothetical protein Ahy_A07g033578 [Arachis hypogaea]
MFNTILRLSEICCPENWIRQIPLTRDSEPCDTQESLERYVRAHIFCVLGTIVFPDKSTVSLNSKFLPLLRDFHRISGYSWGAASLAHLYRSLCCASRYNCKEMDGPLILLFCLGVGAYAVPGTYTLRSNRRCWYSTSAMKNSFSNRPLGNYCAVYMTTIYGSGDSRCPRSPFGSVLYPVASSVIRLPPGPAFDLGHDHCKQLTGVQNHDWGQIYIQWVNRWIVDRYNTLQVGEEIIDFHPLPVYYDWYTQQYGIHLRLSDRVPGEQVGADEPQQQQEEPVGPHQEVPPHEQQEQVYK